MHVSIGRTGFQRRAISPPATVPAPQPAAISPHAAAPPSDSFATTGPSVIHGATTIPRNVAAQATITQSHVCEISSCQPPLRSATKLRRSPSRRPRDRRRSASEVALTAKVAESTTKTLPGFVAAATTPATAGPTTKARLRERPSSAFACWSRCGLIVAGTSPVAAGWKNAWAVP